MFSNLKHVSILVLIVLAVAAGAFATGRYLTPPKTVVVEKLKIEYVEKQVVVEKVNTVVQIVRVTDTIKNVQTDKHIVKLPDGTITIDEHVKDKSEEKTGTTTNATQDANKTSTTEKKETVEQSKVTIITPKPTWSLSLLPGFDVAGALGHGDPYSLLPSSLPIKHLMLGISVDRRLVGPLHTGVWANSAGAGGLVFRLEF